MNSGTPRNGVQLMDVWQLAQAMSSFPCGLRTGPRCIVCPRAPTTAAQIETAAIRASRLITGDLWSMTAHAFLRRRFVDHDHPRSHFPSGCVALRARYPLVGSEK